MILPIGGYLWRYIWVPSDDPRLIDRTGKMCLATTDPQTLTVCLSEAIPPEMEKRVVIHETVHCALWSYGILADLAKMAVPKYRIELEELICNIFADYGEEVYNAAYKFMGAGAIRAVPLIVKNLIA